MDKATYEKYVKTDCFSLRRIAYLKNHKWCEGCGQNIPLQLHHLTYERLGRELDKDLLALCERCHRTFHELPGATPKLWITQHVDNMPDAEKRELVLSWLA